MYQSPQKKSSSWTPTSIQKKSKSFSKPGSSAVQPKRDAKSAESQDTPSYSTPGADLLTGSIMRSVETEEPSEIETSTVQLQSEPGRAAVAAIAPPIVSIPVVQPNSVGIQAKLTVGAPGDVYEQEADRVAAQVMSMPVAAAAPPQVQRFGVEDSPIGMYSSLARSITPVVHRRVDQQVQMYSLVQRAFQAGGTEAPGDLESRLNASKGGGNALAPEVRAFMEPRFGADFSGVRVHTGTEAVQMNRELGAQAFAHGSDVYFGAGKSPGNNELTAHELTHVVQQTGGVKRSHSPNIKEVAAKTNVLSMNQLASSKAAATARMYGRPSLTSTPVIQRSSSNGVSVSGMKFSPKEIPADGKTTSQATVNYSGRIAGGAKINWSIDGSAFGATVDANGLITPGAAITKGEDKVRLKVKAEDSKFPGANTFGFLTLWDADYLQAKIDYPKFLTQKFKLDPFTAGVNGKFALVYQPQARSLEATVRVSFTFNDDLAGAAKWNKTSKSTFEQKFISIVQNRWSNQYQFVNVREPKSIWKKLNPVRVRVKVVRDTKAPHFAITVHKKVIGVGAQVVAGTARFNASNVTPNKGNFPLTGAAELSALVGVTPTPILFAAGKSDVPAADKGKLDFMATYLRRIKNPRFTITITGHHQTVVHAPGDTAAQKTAANQQAKKLSQSRANEVLKILREGRATTSHQIQSRGVGDTGAAPIPAWDKVEMASALPKGWQNVQTTLEHEAGHMLGIGDEYVTTGAKVGDKTSHYALTMQAFGQQYADVQARKVADSNSLMNGGNDIRPHHYVTLWDGLSQLTNAAAVPKVPFTNADWQFQGEG